MANLFLKDPHLRDYFRAIRNFDLQPMRMREHPWSYRFQRNNESYGEVSKFYLDANFTISSVELRSRWKDMPEQEQSDFAFNFWATPHWGVNEAEIFDFLMLSGAQNLRRTCLWGLFSHPDQHQVAALLIDRFPHCRDADRLTFIQALGFTRAKSAIPVIKPYFEQCRQALEHETEPGIADELFNGHIFYHDYFQIAGALSRIDSALEYATLLRAYRDMHSNPIVRWWAAKALFEDKPTRCW